MAYRTLVYLGYGKQAIINEVIYSLLSAYAFIPPDRRDFRFVVYTDNPGAFAGMRAIIERLDDGLLKEWMGPHNHRNRTKHLVLQHAVEKYRSTTALIDSDTYFLKSPDRIFERIQKGHSVMHIWEGLLKDTPAWKSFLPGALCDESVPGGPVTPESSMYNGGVVGLDYGDKNILKETIALNDVIYPRGVYLAQQLSTSVVFSRWTRIQTCRDTVFHYWPEEFRRPFQAELEKLLPAIAGLPEEEQRRIALESRIRPSRELRLRHLAKALCQTMGFYHMRPAIRTSFEPFAGGFVRLLRARTRPAHL